jgi:hypothetical protein
MTAHLAEIIQQRVEVLPDHLQSELINYLFFLEQKAEQQTSPKESDMPKRKKRLEMAFKDLTELKTFCDIVDPVAWQRDQRQDREMPGRTKQQEKNKDQDLPGRTK